MSILLPICAVGYARDPVCPTVTEGGIIHEPFVLELQAVVSVDRQNQGIKPSIYSTPLMLVLLRTTNEKLTSSPLEHLPTLPEDLCQDADMLGTQRHTRRTKLRQHPLDRAHGQTA